MKKLLVCVVMFLGLNSVVSAQESVINPSVLSTVNMSTAADIQSESMSKDAVANEVVKTEAVDATKEFHKKLIYVFYFICLFTGGGIVFI